MMLLLLDLLLLDTALFLLLPIAFGFLAVLGHLVKSNGKRFHLTPFLLFPWLLFLWLAYSPLQKVRRGRRRLYDICVVLLMTVSMFLLLVVDLPNWLEKCMLLLVLWLVVLNKWLRGDGESEDDPPQDNPPDPDPTTPTGDAVDLWLRERLSTTLARR